MLLLEDVKPGDKLIIESIPKSLYSEILRLGISEGEEVLCISKLPGGPVVMENDLQEIAIGNEIAKLIKVRKINA